MSDKYLCPVQNSGKGCIYASDYKIGGDVMGLRKGDFYCKAIEGSDYNCPVVTSLNNQKQTLITLKNIEKKLNTFKPGSTLSGDYPFD